MDNVRGWDSNDVAALVALLTFVVLAAAELLWPARRGSSASKDRIGVNFGLGLVNLCLATVPIFSIAAIAAFAADQGWGLFRWVAMAPWVQGVTYGLAVSLLGYLTHLAFHKSALLWPLHAVHHRDDAVDLSTTLRQHPLAVIILTAAEGALVLLLGPSVFCVILVRTVFFAAALFQHANVKINARAEALIETLLVTPRLHLVHHARDRTLDDSNYGEFLTLWDRLFGTFQDAPSHEFALGVGRATPTGGTGPDAETPSGTREIAVE